MTDLPGTPPERAQLLGRLRRWLEESEPRVVTAFWVVERPGEGARAICPSCGTVLPAAGRGALYARTALGPVPGFRLARRPSREPLFPGEVWYALCPPCDQALTQEPNSVLQATIERLLAQAPGGAA